MSTLGSVQGVSHGLGGEGGVERHHTGRDPIELGGFSPAAPRFSARVAPAVTFSAVTAWHQQRWGCGDAGLKVGTGGWGGYGQRIGRAHTSPVEACVNRARGVSSQPPHVWAHRVVGVEGGSRGTELASN